MKRMNLQLWTQANIDELTRSLQDFKSAKEKPRHALAVRAAETETLPALIRYASGILRHTLDRMVNLLGGRTRNSSVLIAARV